MNISSAIEAIDAYNSQDPEVTVFNNRSYPEELLFSTRLFEKVQELNPAASPELLIAARSQHIGRWKIPRHTYPEGKTGYLNWRKDLAKFHASTSAEILRTLNFPSEFIDRVQEINLKQNLKLDPDVQTIEDALCLVFMEFQLEDFMKKHDDDKMITILKKSWKKMSDQGRQAAAALNFSPRAAALVAAAIS